MANIKTNEIRAWIKRAGITQAELAEEIGMAPSTLSRKMKDDSGSTLTVKEANAICEALRIPREDAPAVFLNYWRDEE